jgi:type III secretion system YopN/LcrE/InvE/MxiC family regulator
MSPVPLIPLRVGARMGVHHGTPLPSHGADVGDEAGHALPPDLTLATPDEALVFLPLAMRGRRTGPEFDSERILVDNAGPLLDEIEHAGAQLPRNAGEALLDLIRQHFVDPSDTLTALKTLRKRLSLEGYAHALDQAEQLLARQVPRRTLLSGANAALSARWHAPGSGLHATELRTLYRRFVDVCPDALDMYSNWIATFDAERRALLITFIYDALVADMDAADPSCTQVEFAPLTRALQTLMRLRSADQGFVARLRAAAGQVGWPDDTDETGETDGMRGADLDTPFARLLMDGLSGASPVRDLVDWLISAGCDTNPARSRAVMVQALIAGFGLASDELYRWPAERDTLLEGLRAELTALAVDERLAGMRAAVRRQA